MLVCVPCREINPRVAYDEEDKAIHATCRETLKRAPYRWSPPKKSNRQAWKRIEKGEWLWDRRRVFRQKKKRNRRDTLLTWKSEIVRHPKYGYRYKRRIPGTEREVTNYNRLPEADLGG